MGIGKGEKEEKQEEEGGTQRSGAHKEERQGQLDVFFVKARRIEFGQVEVKGGGGKGKVDKRGGGGQGHGDARIGEDHGGGAEGSVGHVHRGGVKENRRGLHKNGSVRQDSEL